MTVRELISQLIDMPSDQEVYLYTPDEHEDEHGLVQGYIFHIDNVDVKERTIVFTDWRKGKHNTFTDKAKIPEIWKQIREDRLADAGYPPLSRDLPAEEKRCMNCRHRFENEDYPGSACFNCHELSNWEAE